MTTGLLQKDEPSSWVDYHGDRYPVPQKKGRLKQGRFKLHLAVRDYVMERDDFTCQQCGKTTTLELDHIISRRNGGSHHPDNLQILCNSCNARKGATTDRRGIINV